MKIIRFLKELIDNKERAVNYGDLFLGLTFIVISVVIMFMVSILHPNLF